jgi:hypothetical protein
LANIHARVAQKIKSIGFADTRFGGSITAFPSLKFDLKTLAASGIFWLLFFAVEKQ